jgi:hypothetical protein
MAKPAPLDQIDRLLGAKKRFEYPSGIALKGLHHFMLIKELKWKSPEKNSDAFNGAQSGQSNFENITSGNESKDYYEEGKNFILHLPPGSLKTQYSADYADVNLGIFGDILSQNAFQIAEDLKRHFSSFGKGDTGFIQDTMDVYANMGKSMVDRAKPYYDSGDFRGDFANLMWQPLLGL